MKLSLIVAHGINREIGLDNKLLWNLPEDLANFKKLTTGNIVIMGRKTFESIGKPLPNRTNIVLTKSNLKIDGVLTFNSIFDILTYLENEPKEAFVIGGGQIYKMFLPLVSKLYISKIFYEGKADTYFPKYDLNEWDILEEKTYPSYSIQNKRIPSWSYKVFIKG